MSLLKDIQIFIATKGPLAGRHLISAAGRKYQSAACAAIIEQLRRLPKPTTAPAAVPEAHQPLTDDVSVQDLFLDERVIQRAGGLSGLDAWLERKFECQWPHNEWHSKDFTLLRHAPGSIRLCRVSSVCGAAGLISVVALAETCSTSCWHRGKSPRPLSTMRCAA